MDSSSVVWENKNWIYGEKNTRKSLLKTLDKLSFWMEVFSPNTKGENLWKGLEKLAQKPLENLRENSPQMPQFIGLEKLAVGSQIGQSVDRPVDRPTVRILTVEPAVDRPVDRGTGTESRALLNLSFLSPSQPFHLVTFFCWT